MSMKLMVDAMSAKIDNPLQKLVLIKLADNANDAGECWPSYQHIADQCHISRRTVIRHISELSKNGFLRIVKRKKAETWNQSNVYILTIGGGDTVTLGSDTESLGGSDTESPRTSHYLEPVKEPPRKRGPILIQKYLDQCRQDGTNPIPEDSPVFDYQQKINLPPEYLALAWREFKARSIANKKRYKDWPLAFLNCVRDNWYKLWYCDQDGNYQLTSKGRQADQLHEVCR